MDQVIKRRSKVITKKCLNIPSNKVEGFMIIEVKVSSKGKSTARLMSSEVKNKDVLNCVLSLLSRIQFKNWGDSPASRIYRFFL